MSISFDLVGGHLTSIPVTVGETLQSKFIFDTGIGLNLVSKSLAERASCKRTGVEFCGRRMSGQEIRLPLTEVEALSVGPHRMQRVPAGIFDMSALPEELASVEGFLSLQFFENVPVTLDYTTNQIHIETLETLESRLSKGVQVPLHVRRRGPSVDVFLDLLLPGETIATVEIDTGSDALILDETFMEQLSIRKDSPRVRKVSGIDETGHRYERYFAKLHDPVKLLRSPRIALSDTEVIFQDIIYDGLVGTSFLKNWAVTVDVAGSRIIFSEANRPR